VSTRTGVIRFHRPEAVALPIVFVLGFAGSRGVRGVHGEEPRRVPDQLRSGLSHHHLKIVDERSRPPLDHEHAVTKVFVTPITE
jgi:hypothetical protein